jgi:hypothetical protein
MSCDRCHRWEPLARDGCRKSNRLSPALALALDFDRRPACLGQERNCFPSGAGCGVRPDELSLAVRPPLCLSDEHTRRHLPVCSSSSHRIRSGVAMLVTFQSAKCPSSTSTCFVSIRPNRVTSGCGPQHGERKKQRAAREINTAGINSLVCPERSRVPNRLSWRCCALFPDWAVMSPWQLQYPWITVVNGFISCWGDNALPSPQKANCRADWTLPHPVSLMRCYAMLRLEMHGYGG